MKIETSYKNLKIGIENGVCVARECASCGEWKRADEYYNSPSGAYGKYARCKDCYKKEQYEKEEAKAQRLQQHSLRYQYDQLYNEYQRLLNENKELNRKLRNIRDILNK